MTFMLSVREASAQIIWQINGGNGSWNTAANWSPAGVPNGAGVTVQFNSPTANSNVQMMGAPAGLTVGHMNFTINGAFTRTFTQTGPGFIFDSGTVGVPATITLGGTGSGALTFNNNQVLTLNSNLVITNNTTGSSVINIQGTMGGTGGLTKNGAGVLQITGATSFTGATVVNQGRLTLSGGGNLASTSGITVANGAQLRFEGTNQLGTGTISLAGTGDGSNGALRLQSGTQSLANAITLNSPATGIHTDGGSSQLTLNGSITGTGGLNKTGAGSLILAGNNTFSGTTTVTNGTLQLNTLNSLTSSNGVTIQNGATIQLNLAGERNWQLGSGPLTIQGGGTLRQISGTEDDIAIFAQTITLETAGQNHTLNAPGDSRIYVQGALTGDGNLVKAGGGELRFEGGAKTYTGTTSINNGRLRIDSDGIPVNTSAITLNGGNLRFGQGGTRTFSLGAGGTAPITIANGSIEKTDVGTTLLTNNINVTGPGNLRAREAGSLFHLTGNLTGAGALTFNVGTGGNPTQLGEILLTGNAAGRTGAATLQQGVLTLGSTTVLGGSTFTQISGSTLGLRIDSPAQFGRIITTGNSTINNGATIRPIFNSGLDGGTTVFDIVQGAAVTADVTQINLDANNPLAQYSLNNTGTILQLIADVDYSGGGSGISLNPNQQAVGNFLGAPGGGPAQGLLRGAALNANGPDELRRFYDQIGASDEMGALSSIAFGTAAAQLRNITGRAATRGGGPAPGISGTALLDSLRLDPASLLAATQPAAVVPGLRLRDPAPQRPQWSAFGNLNVLNGRQSPNAEAAGYESATQGFTAGADRFIGQNLLIGAYGGYDRSRAQFADAGGFATADSATFGGYAGWLQDSWHVLGAAQYSRHFFETERNSILGTASGDTEGDQISFMLAGGYDYKTGRWTLGPTASATYSRLWIDSFSESGAPIAQNFRAQDADSFQTAIGGRIAYLFPGSFVSLEPEVRAEYRHEFLDDSRGIESSLAGGGPILRVNTPDPSRDFAVVSTGLNANFADGTTAYVRYEAEVGRSDYTAHGVFGGVRWLFPGGPLRSPVIALADDEKDWREAIMESPVGDAIKFINLSGRLHLQYDYAETEASPGTNPDPQDPEMINRLFIRRLRLAAQRDLGAGFYVEATGQYDEFAQNRVPLGLFNALFGWKPIEEFNLNFGYDKVPFSWEETTSSARIKTVERSVATRTFTKLGDIGEQHVRLSASGRFKEILGDLGPLHRYDLHYEAAIAHPSEDADALWDADMPTTTKNFVSPSYYFRLHNEIRTALGDFDLGADFGWVTFDFRENPGAEAIGYSPFLNYNYGWFNFMAQWMGLSYTGAPGDRAVDTSGFTLQPSFMVHPKWEIVGMYSQYDTNGDEAIRLNQSARNVPTLSPDSRRFDDIRAYYLGFNHFIKGNDIKFSSGVEWIEAAGARPNRPVSAEEALVFRARLQVLF